MISNQILQSTIDGLRSIARVELCVVDVDGKMAATTSEELESCTEAARDFADSPADSQDAAVPHIDGDQDLFALMGGDGSLPQNHFFSIDIIVDGMESICISDPAPLQQDLGHFLPIPPCKMLADLNIVEIILQVFSI